MTTRVGIVGAGPSGLCAAKHAKASGMSCTLFEQSGALGGTWQYTDQVGCDKYGRPIHTSMYRDLRINLPKEIVLYPGTDHKKKAESYITSEEILEYLNNYADNNNIRQYIKLNHKVCQIIRKESYWQITVKDLPTNKEHVYEFDAVFVCNGLNNRPFTMDLKGVDTFPGKTMHSHDYRHPEVFRDQHVLVIGGGPSGMDVANHISKAAKQVNLSHHSEKLLQCEFPENVIHKPDVLEVCKNKVIFKDDTTASIDTIVFCTGFRCDYPFLDESCGISVEEGWVYPLYKHFVNANHPSMCILGNLCHSMQFPTFDIQVRFFLKTLTQSVLPSRQEMLEDIEEYMRKMLANGHTKKSLFRTTGVQDEEYYTELSLIAKIDPLPKVLVKIHQRAIEELETNFPHFRREQYEIIDDETYIVKDPNEITQNGNADL